MLECALRLLLLAGAYAVAGRFGLSIPSFGSYVTLIWLPTGIAVAALVRWGVGYWPGVALGALAVNLWIGSTLPVAAGIAAGNTLGPVAAAWLLRRAGFDPSFARARDVGAFVLAAALSMTVPAAGGSAVLSAAGVLAGAERAVAWSTWWLGDALGVLLGAPVLLTASSAGWQWLRRRAVECAVMAGVALLTASSLFLSNWPDGAPASLILLPPAVVAWAALRSNALGTSLVTLMLALTAAAGVATGFGPFNWLPPADALRILAVNVAFLAGLGLLLNAMLAERRTAENALLASEQRYRQLFDANPLPTWVCAEDDHRFLMVNAATVAAYGYSRPEFLRMRVDALLPPGDVARPFASGADVPGQPAQRRFRTRDGRTLEVEALWQPLTFGGLQARLVLARDVTELRRLERGIATATTLERQRLSRDLHDGLGQELTGIALLVQALRREAERDGSRLHEELVRLHGYAVDALATCRRVAQGLSPLADVQGGVSGALTRLVEHMRVAGGPQIALHVPADAASGVPLEAAEQLYGVAQEALTNALRHAEASAIEVRLSGDERFVRLVVRDDGRGGAGSGATGLGLQTMQHRARLAGGRLSVTEASPHGTVVSFEVPRAG